MFFIKKVYQCLIRLKDFLSFDFIPINIIVIFLVNSKFKYELKNKYKLIDKHIT